jgi:hypothetical protein
MYEFALSDPDGTRVRIGWPASSSLNYVGFVTTAPEHGRIKVYLADAGLVLTAP